jgi:methionyl-tRNA formyltransferase
MSRFIILSEKKWNQNLKKRLEEFYPSHSWFYISKKEDFTIENLEEIEVDKVFIPHWSYIIPKSIYSNFECVVFHMTDLPYGRGGSPLQNLIIRGHTETKVSALKVVKELDAGPIYIKKHLDLKGTAEEIYYRVNDIVFDLVCNIIDFNIKPTDQDGKIVKFDRRTPEMSNLNCSKSLKETYDMIRMLDAKGYPHAFLDTEHLKIEFINAKNNTNEIIANVRITKK